MTENGRNYLLKPLATFFVMQGQVRNVSEYAAVGEINTKSQRALKMDTNILNQCLLTCGMILYYSNRSGRKKNKGGMR